MFNKKILEKILSNTLRIIFVTMMHVLTHFTRDIKMNEEKIYHCIRIILEYFTYILFYMLIFSQIRSWLTITTDLSYAQE